MRHINIALAGLCISALLPLTVGAMTTDELRSQIASLLAAITQLQLQIGQLNASSTVSTPPPVDQGVNTGPSPVRVTCPTLVRTLYRGATGGDVRSLQSFLFSQEYLGADSMTGYFGALTEAAVKRWQSQKGIISSGTASSTGWGSVEARTRAAMLASCDPSIPQNDTLSLGERGLTVTAGVTANAQGSCKAGTYTLDYGDGTAVQTITVPANTCRSLQQTFTHTYASGGSYIIILSSGTNRIINAPVTVVAPPVCNAPVFASDDIPGAIVGVQWTLPLVVSLGATTDITVSATGTPPGIALATTTSAASSTGAVYRTWVLTGAPTVAGTYSLTLTAGNSCGNVSRTLRVPVSNAPQYLTSSCPAIVVPSCIPFTWLGNDSRGCNLGYQCSNAPYMCPITNTPQCSTGYRLQPGGLNSYGCQSVSTCVPNTGTGGTSGNLWTSVSSTVDPTTLPLGDQKYVLDAPKVGYIYACDKKYFTFSSVFGSTVIGSWVHGSTWDATKKEYVHGNVTYPNAVFSITTSGESRTFTGNALPVGVSTGIFPTSASDPAYAYDKNPSSIIAQSVSFSVPLNPTVAAAPTCMALDAGITLDGVELSGPLDSSGRDEVAIDMQDSCNGVAQPGGIYHRHGPSNCMPHIQENNALVGYALDGFGIFSPYDANGKELTTKDLDVCHGITSPIMWDGKQVTMYHYVLTRDFPYSPSCFRGTPVANNFPPRPLPPPPSQP